MVKEVKVLEDKDRQSEIRSKGFRIPDSYGSIKTNGQVIDNVAIDLRATRASTNKTYSKEEVIRAIRSKDLVKMREISDFFYDTNGIYKRICHYFANLYRYDWYVSPNILDKNSVKNEKVEKDFYTILNFLDNSNIKATCGNIALEAVKHGAYYAYIIPSKDGLVLQELPVNYCRSRFFSNNMPVVEFDMSYFDTFGDPEVRVKILKMFPKEFQRGYALYKQGKLIDDFYLRTAEHTRDWLGGRYYKRGCWFALQPGSAVKFSITKNDTPFFINTVPALIDLSIAQGLDLAKQMQQLYKLVIQKLPINKNGDLIFDLDEAIDIHKNAKEMLANTIGLDVITTFADIDVETLSDSSSKTTTDDLDRTTRTVYDQAGTARNLFNPDGNLALEKSILDDEATIRNVPLAFAQFFDNITMALSVNKKKYCFRFYMLETTQYNYKELSKMYKEQVQIGFSKILPQVALGHSQSSILHAAYFEKEILNLTELMIPPLMSSTMSSQDVLGTRSGNASSGEVGRPEKSNDEKSEKTIANKESMS